MWPGVGSRKHLLGVMARAAVLAPLAAVGWLLLSGVLFSALPLLGRGLIATLAAVTLAYPRHALLLVTGFAPLGSVLGHWLQVPYSLTEPLAVAFLAPWVTQRLVKGMPGASWQASPLRVPVGLLALAVATSTVVGLAAIQPFVSYPLDFVGAVLSFLHSSYFADPNSYRPLTAGIQFLEGLGLLTAAVTLGPDTPAFGAALARVSVVSATAVAALSVNRLIEVALRHQDTWQAFVSRVATLRISAVYPDVNAAGSYFAMGVFLAVGLGLAAPRRRWAWFSAAGVLAAALWLTGSRIALFALPTAAATAGLIAVRARGSLRGRAVAVAAAVLLAAIAAGAALPFVVQNPARLSVGESLQYRLGLWRAASAMAADHPAFGVGIGRFRAVSEAYFTPELAVLQRQVFGQLATQENAHNNFLQVLAELGLTGFVPFLWTIAAVARRLSSAVAGRPVAWTPIGLAGGLLAFVITWLSGHPLLVLEVSLAFWTLLGAAAVLDGAPPVPRSSVSLRTSRLVRMSAATLAVLIVVSVPLRWHASTEAADLRGALIGCTQWETSADVGRACWITGPKARFFVAGNASGLRVPFRLVAPDPLKSLEISVYLDGRLANGLRLSPGTWKTLALAVPEHPQRANHQVEVEIVGGGGSNAAVQMGKALVTPRAGRVPED